MAKDMDGVAATCVRAEPDEMMASVKARDGLVLSGKVTESLTFVPDEKKNIGKIEVIIDEADHEEDKTVYWFMVTSLVNQKETLRVGDHVQFQLAEEGDGLAANVKLRRFTARVRAIKGTFGFLEHYVNNNALFFHESEVQDEEKLQTHDQVEFSIVINKRKEKYVAIKLHKVRPTNVPRPDHLRMKQAMQDEKNKVTVTRQPRGPDGTLGFTAARKVA